MAPALAMISRAHGLFCLTAEELTPEEREEKEDLQALGFEHWSKKDFYAFIKGCELHGRSVTRIAPSQGKAEGRHRDNLDAVTKEVEGKTLDEVREYSAVFWDRYEEIEGPSSCPAASLTSRC